MTIAFSQQFLLALANDAEFPPLPLLRHPNWNTLWQAREHLILRARDAAKRRGKSYRNFQVGAAALLSSTKPDHLRVLGKAPHVIYTGANWKLGQDERNTCAEQEIVAQIRQQRHMFPARKILALVIAGNAQDEPDRESGVFTPTLHPCSHCRKLLRNVPEVHHDTIVMTVSQRTEAMEAMTFADLLNIHSTSSS